jgi:lipoprotein signal peptidase
VWSSVRLRIRPVLRWLVVRWLGLVVVAIVCADQVTKALVPRAWVSVDPGTGAYLPSFLRDQWKGPVSGALLDGAGVCVLAVLGWLVARRFRGLLARLGGAILLAGLASNLLDRLGLATLTQGVPERGVINWFNFGFGSLGAGNIADICYVTGALLLLAGAAEHVARRMWRHPSSEPRVASSGNRSSTRNRRRLALAVLCVMIAAAAFGWAGFWQGDRRAAVASAQIDATQAHLRTMTNDLDQAVLEAYVHGDKSAQQLLPANQWISCSLGVAPTCVVDTISPPQYRSNPPVPPIRIVAGPVRGGS